MGVPNGEFVKVVYSGQINDQDRWSINLWFEVTTGNIPSDDTLQQVTDDFADDFDSTFWSAGTSPYKAVAAACTTYDKCKTYAYFAGALFDEAENNRSGVVGTSANAQPAYCAQVFSLRTAGFGKSARGRVYLPRTGVSNSGTTLQFTNTQAHVDHFAALIETKFRGPSGNTALAPRVMSLTTSSARNITRVLMDSKPDTQRGRESKQTATSVMSHSVP